MQMLYLTVAGIGVAAMAYCMIKQYETRLVLFYTGMVMALCAGGVAPAKAYIVPFVLSG